jgi:type IV pilus assembly protein PilX
MKGMGESMMKLKMQRNGRLVKQQKGLVLFIALIALVAMSLAAAALVRSVDSGVLVAGNLAFRQSTMFSAESGIAGAYKHIKANAASLETNSSGYFASFDPTFDGPPNKAFDSSTWGANSFVVTNDVYDLSQNETRFIIQRMCNSANVPDNQKAERCLVGTGESAANSKGSRSEGGGSGGGGYDAATGGSDAVVYRVTARVAGPKNTFSYVQAFIY